MQHFYQMTGQNRIIWRRLRVLDDVKNSENH